MQAFKNNRIIWKKSFILSGPQISVGFSCTTGKEIYLTIQNMVKKKCGNFGKCENNFSAAYQPNWVWKMTTLQ